MKKVKKECKYPGVYWHAKLNKWRVEIHQNGKKKHIDYFDFESDAIAASLNARREIELGKIYCIADEPVTAEYLRANFTYNHLNGEFREKKTNRLIGWIDKQSGYRKAGILGKEYRIHRLIWLYMTGEWPRDQIDHGNHNRLDNRWINLNDVTSSENGRNKSLSIQQKHGIPGLRFCSRSKEYYVKITVDYVTYQLGSYKLKETAIKVRKHFELWFGFHENHGKPTTT